MYLIDLIWIYSDAFLIEYQLPVSLDVVLACPCPPSFETVCLAGVLGTSSVQPYYTPYNLIPYWRSSFQLNLFPSQITSNV